MLPLRLSPTKLRRAGRSALGSVAERAVAPTKPLVQWAVEHAVVRLVFRRAAAGGDLQGRLILESRRLPTEELTGLMSRIRESGPVHKGGFSYITARHAVVKEVLTSNDLGAGMLPSETGLLRLSEWADPGHFHPVRPPSLLATEPPDHTRYRKLVTRVFTARAVEQLRERTEQIATELLDDLARASAAGEEVDLVEAYCGLLPVTVISEILGVPTQERRKVLELGTGAAASLDMGLTWREYRRVEASLAEFEAWLDDHLERLAREVEAGRPADHLLARLVAAREDGVGLTPAELRATAGLVLAAGFETTVNLLSNGISLLRRHPHQLALLREQPELWPNAVDEILRVDPPVLLTARVAHTDTEVGGVPVRHGSVVTAVLAGANRDPEVFTNPDRFDVTRENARDHLSFSSGRHYCLGAALARMEGEVGLRALFDRFPDLELRPGARRRSTRVLRGYERLPAVLGAS